MKACIRNQADDGDFDWEFLPYNDASMLPKVTKTFQADNS